MKWICAVSALLAASLAAQQTTFVPANDVSFTISTGRNDYGAGEQIVVKYQITNISNHPLYVPLGFQQTACLDINHGPHIWGWFENSAGRHFTPGYGGSCGSTPGAVLTIAQRMNGAAALLRPGEHLDGVLQLNPAMFSLPPGAYRIEATLTGWDPRKYTDAERTELEQIGNPFIEGEVPASMRVNLQ
jgi:hypothetical protein